MTDSPGTSRPAPMLDAGWLFLLAGLALLGATILIPASNDLREARWLRDRALVREAHRKARIDRYEGYLDALDSGDADVIYSLAAMQLNQLPEDRGLIAEPPNPRATSASVFPALEPPPLVLPDYRPPDSTLARLATGERSRLWMIAAGAACVLVGLLPASRPRRSVAFYASA